MRRPVALWRPMSVPTPPLLARMFPRPCAESGELQRLGDDAAYQRAIAESAKARSSGEYAAAVETLRRYLAAQPQGAHRPDVEKRLLRLMVEEDDSSWKAALKEASGHEMRKEF